MTSSVGRFDGSSVLPPLEGAFVVPNSAVALEGISVVPGSHPRQVSIWEQA